MTPDCEVCGKHSVASVRVYDSVFGDEKNSYAVCSQECTAKLIEDKDLDVISLHFYDDPTTPPMLSLVL